MSISTGIRRIAAVLVVLAASGASAFTLTNTFSGVTLYVDASAAKGGTGSKTAPFQTIQDAVSAARELDTIIIAAGEYNVGTTTDTLGGSATLSRVKIDKKLWLKGAGRDKTIVIGADATSPDDDGLGMGAVRGLLATPAAKGSIIEGITFTGGRTLALDKSRTTTDASLPNIRESLGFNSAGSSKLAMTGQNIAACGGGVYYSGTNRAENIYLVDCRLTHCTAGFAGGAIYGYAVLIRTLVDNSRATTAWGGAITRVVGAYNSVFASNGKTFKDVTDSVHGAPESYASGFVEGTFINCTMTGNLGAGVPRLSTSTKIDASTTDLTACTPFVFRNCIAIEHGALWRYFHQNCKATYCCQNHYGSLPNAAENILDKDGKPIPKTPGGTDYFKKNTNGNIGGDYYPRLSEDAEGTTYTSSPCYLHSDVCTPVKFGASQFAGGYDRWHLRKDSFLIDKGDSTAVNVEAVKFVPNEYIGTDYYGEKRIQGAAVDMGAAEGGVEFKTEYVMASQSNVRVNGFFIETYYFGGLKIVGEDGEVMEWEATDIQPNEELWGFARTDFSSVRTPTNVLRMHSWKDNRTSSFPYCDRIFFPDFRGKKVRFRYENVPGVATLSFSKFKSSKVYWVDAVNGDDITGDGSEAKPLKTLQHAADSLSAFGVILAKPGVYDQGGVDSCSVTDADWPRSTGARLQILKNLRVVGVEGAEKTIIMGAKGTSGFINTGCGTGGKRCIAVAGAGGAYAQVQGFTLTGGHTDSDPIGKSLVYQTQSGKSKKTGDQEYCYNWTGGALCAASSDYYYGHITAHIVDCIVSNNVAYQAAAFNTAFAKRCLITANRNVDPAVETNGTKVIENVTQNSILSNCILCDNDCLGAIINCNGGFSGIENCFISEPKEVPPINLAKTVFNTVFYKCGGTLANFGGEGNVVWPESKTWINEESRIVADPMAGTNAKGYFRVYKESPIRWAGVADPQPGSPYAHYALYSSGMTCGKPENGGWPVWNEKGKTAAGCYQQYDPYAMLVEARGVKKGGVEPEGWLPMDAPQSVTVTATGTRRMVGYLMNGTLIETDERTYTFPVSQWTGETAIFAVIYATNLYVNAVSGSDLNDGFTPEQAKKTLNGILAEALPGDVVHAAEGVYNENCHAHDENIWNSAGATHVLPAVGIVPADVTLLADGRQEKTIIEGQWGGVGGKDKNPYWTRDQQNMTFGWDAIRCLVVHAGSRIEGFTLRNGGTFSRNMPYPAGLATGNVTEEDSVGGAVLGPSGGGFVIKNCFFTNCVAISCTAFSGAGKAIGCRFVRMGTGGSFAVTQGGYLYNCYIDKCFDSPVSSAKAVVNCVMTEDNHISFDSSSNASNPFTIASDGVLENSVILAPRGEYGTNDTVFTGAHNCRFNVKLQSQHYILKNCVNCTFVDPATLKLDGLGCPAQDSPLVDAGRNAGIDENPDAAEGDIVNTPRILNGAVDIGCYEWDWRPVYSADLVHGRVTVVEASSNVTHTIKNNVLMTGRKSRVYLTWPGSGSCYQASFQVTGKGTLSVYNQYGQLLGEYVYADGIVNMPVIGPYEDTAFTFVYELEPGVKDLAGAGAVLLPFKNYGGLMLYSM